jgi:Ferritin-like domain
MKRFRANTDEMQTTEAELVSMTADLQDAHRDTLPALMASLGSWGEETEASEDVPSGFSRRTFLTRGGLLAAGGLLIASSGAAAASTVPRLAGRRGVVGALAGHAMAPLDVRVAALAASLENLAVGTYAAALSAAGAGKLGTVPKAIGTFATTAMAQHKDHAAAWNALVTSAGYDAITAPNATIGKTINAAFAKVTTVPGVAKLALTLEDAAAATYLEAIGVVTETRAIETAATIQPVEMQHAAILNFVLGSYPVPNSFALLGAAAPLSATPAVTKK